MNRHREHTRIGTRLFEPEEVATVIDLFAPMRLALEHARAKGRCPRLPPWREWKVPILVMGAMLAVGGTGAALQARVVAVPTSTPLPMRLPARPAAAPPLPALAVPEEAPPIAPAPRLRPRAAGDTELLAALNRRALAEYQHARTEPAVRLLSQAARLCQRPALAWNGLCATTHVNLGRVLAGGYGQSGLAARHYRIAEAIRPGSTTAGGRVLRGGLTSGDRSGARGR